MDREELITIINTGVISDEQYKEIFNEYCIDMSIDEDKVNDMYEAIGKIASSTIVNQLIDYQKKKFNIIELIATTESGRKIILQTF